MTGERYGFIAGIIREVLVRSARERVDVSRNIDLVLTNQFPRISDIYFFHLGHVPTHVLVGNGSHGMDRPGDQPLVGIAGASASDRPSEGFTDRWHPGPASAA